MSANQLVSNLLALPAEPARGRKLFEKQLWDYADETGLLREAAR